MNPRCIGTFGGEGYLLPCKLCHLQPNVLKVNSTGVMFTNFCFISGILCLSWSGHLSTSEQGTTIHAEDNTHRLNISIVVSMLTFPLAILDCNWMKNAVRSSIYIYLEVRLLEGLIFSKRWLKRWHSILDLQSTSNTNGNLPTNRLAKANGSNMHAIVIV